MKKTYCDECAFLQNREVKTNDGIVTGTRYYCSKKKKWFSIGATLEEIGFSYCAEGANKNGGKRR
jgi:hypothetical protein